MRSGESRTREGLPVLLVHGGAWNIPHAESHEHREGLVAAVSIGSRLLEEGASALDVVTAVVVALEDHPAFDAGRGAVLNRDGQVELDAGVMAGHTLAYGAVAGTRRVRNPVAVARSLLEREDGQVRFLVAESAERYAEQHGMALVENGDLIVDRELRRFEVLRERDRYHTSFSFLDDPSAAPGDTVGCVARDREGRLAAATSTGGTPYTLPGRVGDSPIPGAGFYADERAAVSATGWGEAISALSLSVRAADAVSETIAPAQAARLWLGAMRERIANPQGDGAAGGLILIDRWGRGGWAYTTPRMARAGWRSGGEAWVAL